MDKSMQTYMEHMDFLNQHGHDETQEFINQKYSERYEKKYLWHHFELVQDEKGKDISDKKVICKVCWIGKNSTDGLSTRLGFVREYDSSLTFVEMDAFVKDMVGRPRPDIDANPGRQIKRKRQPDEYGLPSCYELTGDPSLGWDDVYNTPSWK